ncbi:GNAT family N-acetyltransferase [Streptomyces sp. RerS4]|uniref:GNAT family N-acetyltransferase n=1 Tax=Streptomyces sp. RerS4 TaxID=2942449 RepID=UPI00201C9037|nr:GNAT family N-acetyltransferase [Streptomyces sp. RerS4]UQX02181.1 GNAT family N-acetyltransferase [Streptomyces sp. RerS4]
MGRHVVRAIRADEWQQVRALRLDALRDPVAPVAFLETVERAEAYPDVFWQERTRGGAEGRGARQFIAEGPDGRWDGSVTVLVEDAGSVDLFGEAVRHPQGHVVRVFVREGQRGTGLTEALFAAAVEWAWALEGPALERVRLFVHEGNARAAGFYRKFGFVSSGRVVTLEDGGREHEYVLRRGQADTR